MTQPELLLTNGYTPRMIAAGIELDRLRERTLSSFEHQDWVRRRAAALRGQKPPRREGSAGAPYRHGPVTAHEENATVTRSFRGRS